MRKAKAQSGHITVKEYELKPAHFRAHNSLNANFSFQKFMFNLILNTPMGEHDFT
jgi:hypothetical protein